MNNPNIRPVELAPCSAGKVGAVLSVEIAAGKALIAAKPVTHKSALNLIDAIGRVTSSPAFSAINLPPFANSAMDGYAISVQGLVGAGPWQLPVSGRIIAGCNQTHILKPGTAIRIMTGAPMPEGADTVLMQEHCQLVDNFIHIVNAPTRGKNIRLPGEDVHCASILIDQGELITARHAALLAACGSSELDVFRKVRIGILSTGTELVEPGTPLKAGQIYNSNRVYLMARLMRPWIETIDYGIVSDDPSAIRALVQKAAQECDIVITTGGVSAGEEDHMLDVLRAENAAIEVLKVAMRPGKPVSVGKIGNALWFGLPGNPYACAITFMQIAWPAIRKVGGLSSYCSVKLKGVAGFSYQKKPGSTEYIPVTWTQLDQSGLPLLQRLAPGSSASIAPFAAAKAIAVLPAEMTSILPGDHLVMEPAEF